jgi:5-methylcytosine-specific restriction endonuclease McrA
MEFKFDRPRQDRISDEVIIAELQRIAELVGYRTFTRHEFDQMASLCKGSVVLSRFKKWSKALEATGLNLKCHKNPRKDQISKNDLICELARVWKLLGHRPSKTEWDNSDAKYSYTTYKTRFGGWVNACMALVENGTEAESSPRQSNQPKEVILKIPKEKSRNVPLKIRLGVLKRDDYKCVLCGRSPATHAGVTLHLDHIVPYSNGGAAVKDNLRTLCAECNWGKGNNENAT